MKRVLLALLLFSVVALADSSHESTVGPDSVSRPLEGAAVTYKEADVSKQLAELVAELLQEVDPGQANPTGEVPDDENVLLE